MRYPFVLLLVCTIVLPAAMNAQLSWSKHTYDVTGLRAKRGDFNGDGLSDLFIYGGDTISVLTNSNGTFNITNLHTLNMQLDDAALLDFNGDGKMDVAGCTHNRLIILQGSGDGSLSVSHDTSIGCQWVVSNDFNHDGNPDIAVGITGEPLENINEVIVLLGDGHGDIASTIDNLDVNFTSSEGNPCSIDGRAVAADFNGDKVPDLFITADCPNDVVSFSSVIVGIGDGTGHFTFHRDVETRMDAAMVLRLTEGNNDGKNDVIGVGQGSAPHGAGSSALMLFVNHGDGTFESKTVASQFSGEPGGLVRSGSFADFDGDGIKDGLAMIDSFDSAGAETMSMQFYKGQTDGTYKLAQISSLASDASDMVWGDYNKDGRADVALLRPLSTDLWLNTTRTAPICPGLTTDRSLAFCEYNVGGGTHHFIGTPLDKLPIKAMQIYEDGVVKFLTPDDLLDTNLDLSPGKHRITAKAWDDAGSFSSTINLTVQASCTNSTNHTVHICAPNNGASFTSSGGKASVEIIATAASNLSYSATQIYVDGKVVFSTASKSVDDTESVATGAHRITVKGWDSSGAFSSTLFVNVE
jgi:hypothetical protein